MSPSELISPLPESYRSGDEEKEVVPPNIQPEVYHGPTGHGRRKKRICGVPLLGLWILIGILIVLAIALGVGLGVGLTRHKSNNNSSGIPSGVDATYLIGGDLNPEFYSDTGAFNGSGIAVAQQSFTSDLSDSNQGSLVMYFQHHSGEIRWKQLSSTGDWIGGDFSYVVAVDAKNSTPLSAVSYVLGGASTWHIFYVDQNNTLKERWNSNKTNGWQDGSINDLNLKVFDAEMVGMQACWYGNDYGDSDYTHTPLPNEDANATKTHETGMHMWVAIDNSTFQQLGWRADNDTWQPQQQFTNMNGHAGVGCYSWGPGTTTYVMFVNQQNTVEFYWKDTNTNTTGTDEHPINVWTNSSIAINNVYPASSLGYTNFFYAQDNDSLMFQGYNISWAAENTTIVTADNFVVGSEPGLPGSHLSVSAIPQLSGGSTLTVFYQQNGSDISEYTRDLYAGQWSSVEIDIPQ